MGRYGFRIGPYILNNRKKDDSLEVDYEFDSPIMLLDYEKEYIINGPEVKERFNYDVIKANDIEGTTLYKVTDEEIYTVNYESIADIIIDLTQYS